MSTFQLGDVVQIKSGSPSMTISDIGDYSVGETGEQSAKCVWFDGSKPNSQVFPLHTLTKVVSE